MRIRRKRIRELYGPSRLRTIVVLPDPKVCYVPVPKAGCSTVKLWLERIYTNTPDLEEDQNIHMDRTTPTPKMLTWPVIHDLERNGLFGFTIVRDPIRRALSAFTEKMPRAEYRRKINTALGRDDLSADVNLDDFISALELMDPVKMDPHWKPQHMVAMTRGITYDHIGKLESLEKDLALVAEKTGLAGVGIPWLNAVSHLHDATVTRDQRLKLAHIYQRDFERFGY